ncbi:MAG: hypothetical protein ACOCQD_01445 [archaeon]
MKVFLSDMEKETPQVYFNLSDTQMVEGEVKEGNLDMSGLTYDNIHDMKSEISSRIEIIVETMRQDKVPHIEEPIVMEANLSEVNAKHIIIENDCAVGVEIETPTKDVDHIVYLNEEINNQQNHGFTSKNFRLEDFVSIRDTVSLVRNWEPVE